MPNVRDEGLTLTNDTISKRHQTKILLVSLIESLCQNYGDSPESTRKIFFTLCQTLRSFGFIDTEFEDEVAGMRSNYHQAFEHLFYTTAQAIRQQDLTLSSQRKLLTLDQKEEINQDISPLKYSLSIQNSRYRNDFVEGDILGRGGFASAWRARNKLDDIEYAIKKIRLANNQEGYDKIFREIKNLARLEHHNVVRYYSSWLEYASQQEHSDDEDDDYEDNSTDESNIVFHQQDDDNYSNHDNNDNSNSSNNESHRFHCHDDALSFISFENNSHSNSSLQDSYSQTNSSSSSSCSENKKNQGGGFTLFIQMQLCPSKSSLCFRVTIYINLLF